MRPEGIVAMIALVTVPLAGCGRQDQPLARRPYDLFSAGAGGQQKTDLALWKKALDVRNFEFPQDHAAHEQYRIEWWYYTGNLVTKQGRRLGYQLTFFRTGTNYRTENPSRWSVRDLYTAHFALSDLKAESHVAFQRNHRRGVGWAGAATDRYDVWNGNWRAFLDGRQHRLVAQQDDCALDLVLDPLKPIVLHGQNGLSRKGATPGNSSYYYSLTRLSTSGRVRIDGEDYEVEGKSWMDHEFSSSLLEAEQSGWDWFSIQFDDDQELMLYRMRREDGAADQFSSGSFVASDGSVRHLAKNDFRLSPTKIWTSPHTQAEYPIGWRVEIPNLAIDVQVKASFPDQEMVTRQTTGIAYWEGSISVTGQVGERRTNGVGYLEMTGYSGRSLGELFRTDND